MSPTSPLRVVRSGFVRARPKLRSIDVMKTSVDHLPEHKRQQLVTLYRKHSPAEMIVLFGSRARGDWVDDREGPYFSDYALLLLVVNEEALAMDTALWSKLEDQARRLTSRTLVNDIVHDIGEVNEPWS